MMSISIGAFPQLNNYYRPQNGNRAVAQNSVQSEEIRDKNDPNYICQTCKQRKYKDQSNDSGVSFKSPGHIAPGASASVVMSHEQEHVSNEQANARAEERRVVSQSVVLHYSVCPECQKSYVSGGTTRTVTAADNRKSSQNLLDIRV